MESNSTAFLIKIKLRHSLGRPSRSDFVQSEFSKEGFTVKKIGLGIAILLFAIVITLCSSGMELLSIGIGIVGLIFSIIGFMERK